MTTMDVSKKKSAGHLLFTEENEYFVVNGEVYVAPRYRPLADANGTRRHGRWEASLDHFKRYQKLGVYPKGVRNRSGRPSSTKSAVKARLLKAWRNQHNGRARGYEVADAMQAAIDVGMTQAEIDSVMDIASGHKSINVGRVGDNSYKHRRNQSGGRVSHAWPPGSYMSHGHYAISDKFAGQLVRAIGRKLPPHGHELTVKLEDGRPATLIRTPMSSATAAAYGMRPVKRGWVWALYNIEGYNHR